MWRLDVRGKIGGVKTHKNQIILRKTWKKQEWAKLGLGKKTRKN